MKRWEELDWATCDHCGSSPVIAFTDAEEGGFVFDGDTVRCIDCGAKGEVSTDGAGGADVHWEENPHAKTLIECLEYHEERAKIRHRHAKETRDVIAQMDSYVMRDGVDYDNDLRNYNLEQATFDQSWAEKHKKWADAIRAIQHGRQCRNSQKTKN